ncbi:hypothetical protein BDQ94DRAFT_51391 [Aspergillus welwitschiae]|uniref:Uncharacterized protein n=1 Tax=Aspergillus welwitschiae TaxID=1341132 RepID=A0A3F3PZE2_9EURO|nr:hypothetical protein BDQ94DRAFT_51391 [Aspergillus welwitschiae]RDH32258.1 hypothetical protein BDQ94DRAFT_51391 [Aspergillus welwitschiae]
MHCDAVIYGLVDIVLEFPTSRCMVEAYPASARRTQSNQPIAYAGPLRGRKYQKHGQSESQPGLSCWDGGFTGFEN